jgi:hypothetical protein
MRLAKRSRVLMSVAVTVFAGCGNNSPEPPVAEFPYVESGVTFSVKPVDGQCGASGRYVADVAWSVPSTSSAKMEVQVDSRERKVFARSDSRVGKAATGEWVVPGLAFYLVDREAERVLGAIKAPRISCVRMPASR